MNPQDIDPRSESRQGYPQGNPGFVDNSVVTPNYTADITQASRMESLEEPLEVHTVTSPQPRVNDLSKGFLSGAFFSRRRAMIISTLITLSVLLLTIGAMAFLVRRAPDDKQQNDSKISEQRDVKIEGALDSTIPKELQGAQQSLLVNGDVVTRGNLRISSGGFATVIRVLDPTEDQTITLPSGSGTLCLDTNNCGYAAFDDLNDALDQLSTLQGNVDDINDILSDLEDRTPAAGVDTLNGEKGTVSIQGSPNRINVSTNNGVVTLNTPQDLDSNANVQFGSLTVSSLVANGVLVGNGASPILSVTAGGAGLCLMSTAGAPSFQVCPGGSSSFTLTATSGTSQTINGGDTVTIAAGNNVTTTAGATDTVTVGTVNNPDFTTSVTTPLLQSSGALSITPGGAFTVGATSQTTLLQGSTTTITSNGAGNDIVLTSANQIRLTGFNCAALGNGGKLTTDASGNLSCAADNGSAGAAITGAGNTNRLALFTGTNSVADSWLLQNGSTLELDNTRNLSLMGGNFSVTGTSLFSGLVTANGGITVAAGQTLTFNGDAFTDLTGTGLSISSGSLQTTLGTSVDLTSEVNGILPVGNGGTGLNSGAAANGQLLVGNGTGFTLATVTQGAGITITNGAGSVTVASTLGVAIDSAEITDLTITNADIANSTINLSTKTTGNYVATVADSGSGVISVSGSGSNNAAVTLGLVADSIGDTQLAFNTGQNLTTASSPSFAGATVTGGTFTVGTTSQLASLVLHDGNGQTTTLRPGDSTGNLTFTLPTADGSANQCIKTNASGALSFGNCVASIGGGGGVTGSGTQNRLSKFDATGTNLVDSTLSDNGTTVSTTVNLAVQGGGLTLGTALQNAALTLYGNGFTANIDTSAINANNSYSLPSGIGGDFCIKQLGNCSGSGGGNAPNSAQYLTLALDSGLSAERTLSFNGTNFSVVDNGANNSYTVNTAQAINTSAAPSFAGLTLTGNLQLNANTLQGTTAVIDFTNFDVASNGNVTAGTYNGQTISTTASLTGTLAVAGLTTLNGGLTVEAGDTLTVNGDAFTDLTGNGLQVSTNTLTLLVQASKGLEVDSNGLSLIDCSSGEILKYNGSNQWACAADAGGSGVGDNVQVNGTNANDANFVNTAASGGTVAATTFALNVGSPDQITLTVGVASATDAGVITAGTQTFGGAKTFNGLITAAAGVTVGASQNLTVNGDAVQDLTGNGLQVTSNSLTLLVQGSKGLEVDSNGISLIDCSTNEILKYNGSNQWACATDAGSSGLGDDVSVNGSALNNANFIDRAATATSAAVSWTFNVAGPDQVLLALGAANGTDAGIVTANAQTFGGAKTFNGNLTIANTASFATSKGTDYSTTGAQNNVAISTASLYRLTGASAQTINGIVAGRDGQTLTLVNAGSNAATLVHMAGGQTAGNQISTGTAGNISLPVGSSISLIYDSTAAVWRVIGDASDSGCSTCASTDLSNIASTNLGAALNKTSGNLQLQTTTSGDITMTTATGAGLANVLTGNLKVGNGTPDVTLNGEDAYVEGTFEVDGTARFDGILTVNAASTFNESLTVAANKSITLTGGTTANRPSSPTDGMLFYDQDTDQLLVYANGKWQAEGREAVLVAANDSSPAAKAAADYIADGTADQAEINSAITEATTTTGNNLGSRKVYLFAGTYNTDDVINMPNNTLLAGSGSGTIIKFAALGAAVTKNMIANSDTSTGTGVTIRDLRLDGNKTNNASGGTQRGISLNGMGGGTGSSARQGALVEGVTVVSFKSENIYLTNSSNNKVANVTSQDSTSEGLQLTGSSSNNLVTGSKFQGNGGNGFLANSSSSSNTISSNNAQGNASGGFASLAANNTLSGNTSNGNGYGFFLSTGATGNTVSGNTAQGNTNAAFSLSAAGNTNNTITGNTATGGTTGFDVDGTNNTITGNTAQGNTTGISLAADESTITGNTILTTTTYGILITAANNNAVSSNKIYNSGGAATNNAIYLTNADSNSITGNNITDTSATTNNYAINVNAATDDTNYIANNTLGGGSINDAGTGTIYGGQVNASSNFVIQPAGTVELMKNTNVTGTLNVTSDVDTNGSLTVGNANQFVISNTGIVTSGTWQAGTIGLLYGGTNNTSYTTNGIVYSNGTSLVSTVAGSTGQCLLASTGSAPSWGTCTATDLPGAYAATATTSGAAEITLADAKGLRIIAADTTTDPSVIMKLNCTACGTGTAGNFLIQNASSNALLSVAGDGTIEIGSANNGIYLAGTSGSSSGTFTLKGTARNSKKIRLHAEYPSVVLTPDGSNNTGTMTSGYDNASSARMSYYNWTTTQVANQDYDIVVQVPLPSDFDGWDGSNPLSITGYTTNTTNGTIALEVRDSIDTQICNFVSVTPGSTNTWTPNTTACTLSTGTYTPGDYITLRIRLQAPTSGNTRVGNIVLNYKSKF
jgi:parallel beta-helix repeat protein